MAARSSRIDGQEHASGGTMEVRVRRAGGGDRSPSRRQGLPLLNRTALKKVDEFGAGMPMQRKRSARREPHELHRLTIRGTEVLTSMPSAKSICATARGRLY